MIAAIVEYIIAGFAALAALCALFPVHAIAASITCFLTGLGPGFWLGLAVRMIANVITQRREKETKQ
jgi:hypothetical protein